MDIDKLKDLMGRVTPDMLRQLIRYEPDTGKMFWMPRGPGWFSCNEAMKSTMVASWNSRFAGSPALHVLDTGGYFSGYLLGRKSRAHRVAYAIYHDKWPEGFIDHINGIRTDNRAQNLRAVSRTENAHNSRLAINNTSGRTGVAYRDDTNRWVASIDADRKRISLGSFSSRDDAVAARIAAELKYGFHPNHGMARHG